MIQNQNPHTSENFDFFKFLNAKSLWKLFLVITISSAILFILAIVIQIPNKNWDLEGAVSLSIILPSFAGLGLALFAIFIQIRTSSPSYKAAETTILRLLELRYKILQVAKIMNSEYQRLSLIKNMEDSTDFENPTDEDLNKIESRAPMPFDEMNELAIKASTENRVSRCAEGFEITSGSSRLKFANSDEEDNLNAGFGSLASSLFPVIEALQPEVINWRKINNKLAREEFDFHSYELEVDALTGAFKAVDDENRIHWVASAQRTILKLATLLTDLEQANLLEISAIERALKFGSTSDTIDRITKEFNETNAFMNKQASTKPFCMVRGISIN